MKKTTFKTVDEYISVQSPVQQAGLKQLRKTVQKAVPEAEELISYQMPAYKFHGILLYFAAYSSHFGFYAMPEAIIRFKDKLKTYKTSKGTIQFPVGKPLPLSLISEIVKFRVKENLDRTAMKEQEKKKKTVKQ